MKKAITKTRTIISVFITILILSTAQVAQSAGRTLPDEIKKSQLDFKFVEKLSSGPLFQLNMNNTEAGEFIVKVRDADGNVLFTERLKGVNISRKYQLAIDGEELYNALDVRFEITSLKSNETFKFNATNRNRTVSDIIIAKL